MLKSWSMYSKILWKTSSKVSGGLGWYVHNKKKKKTWIDYRCKYAVINDEVQCKLSERWTNMIIGVEAWVDNPIHIKVEIIKLNAIWVWQDGIYSLWALFLSLFNGFNHNIRVLVYQPSIKRRHTHLSPLSP